MLKEKLVICPYEENYCEEELIKIQDDIKESDEELIEKFTVELNEESDEDSDEESHKELDEKSDKESTKKLIEELSKESEEELIEELMGIIRPKNDTSTTDRYDKNKFNKIPTTIGSNNFNHKNKIGKFKFNDINDLVNNSNNNTISEADAKQKQWIKQNKKEVIKDKHLIASQKILLKLFDELIEAIFNNI